MANIQGEGKRHFWAISHFRTPFLLAVFLTFPFYLFKKLNFLLNSALHNGELYYCRPELERNAVFSLSFSGCGRDGRAELPSAAAGGGPRTRPTSPKHSQSHAVGASPTLRRQSPPLPGQQLGQCGLVQTRQTECHRRPKVHFSVPGMGTAGLPGLLSFSLAFPDKGKPGWELRKQIAHRRRSRR